MQYRRRLRTRIIFSFFLLGFGLTALFALSSLYLRAKLEGQLIESTLQREVDNFVAQVRTNPPIFLLHINDKKLMHFTYERFLENRIRERYPFEGTPIRISFRERRNKDQ